MEETKKTAETMGERAKQIATDAQADIKETTASMATMAHKVLLAGVGAVALTKDEIEEFVTRLVERGEIAEQDGRQLVKDVVSRRRNGDEQVEEQIERTESVVDERIESILARLNVPTKSDIDALSKKITLLTEKVDALKSG